MKTRFTILAMGLISFLFGGSKTGATAAEKSAGATPFNPAKIYPYVVPAAYLDHQPAKPEGLTYPLGHGLHVTLVQDFDGAVRNVTPKQAHARAIENLVAVVKSGAVTMQRFSGPQGKPFIIFTDHWLSASCVLLPDLRVVATKNLGTDDFCICLPQRDSMLVFPAKDDAFRSEMMSVIRKNEADARKPLSFGLFQLGAKGIQEFKDGK